MIRITQKTDFDAVMGAGIYASTPHFALHIKMPATHNRIIRAALATPDKEYALLDGATHYYAGQPEKLAQCVSTVIDWSVRKGLLAQPPAA